MTALEEEKEDQTTLVVGTNQISIDKMKTLTTVQVQTTRVLFAPTNGKKNK